MTSAPQLLSISEVARIYRMRRATVRAAVASGRLPGKWRGKPSRIRGGIVRPGKTLMVSAKRSQELWGMA